MENDELIAALRGELTTIETRLSGVFKEDDHEADDISDVGIALECVRKALYLLDNA